jgi:hypothetical protein
MLALAGFTYVDLDELEAARRRLTAHEAQYDRALIGSSRRMDMERLMAEDIDILATAYKRLARAVERMPVA